MGPKVEIRRDVWIGVSLEAPHMRYPGHRHPSEEICVVGRAIVQASDPWHSSGIGGWVPMLRTSDALNGAAPAGVLVPLDGTVWPLI